VGDGPDRWAPPVGGDVREREGGRRALAESKARYQPVQKLLYAVLITSRKLRHYFQEYSISVVTDYPLGDILQNKDATGRISKWAVKLGALNIDFKPRTAIKS
jgi:hypothetical protein